MIYSIQLNLLSVQAEVNNEEYFDVIGDCLSFFTCMWVRSSFIHPLFHCFQICNKKGISLTQDIRQHLHLESEINFIENQVEHRETKDICLLKKW